MNMANEPKFNFGLKNPGEKRNNDLFAVTDPANIKPYEIRNIDINKLIPFKNHPFKMYEGQRFDDMCESIKENGILTPVIIRPADAGEYEILSGHNRTEAARAVGLEVVPAIIRDNLTDADAMLIVTETNLIQRSFTDLSHSERAVTLAMHHEAVKRQGKRTDLINEIENLLKNDENLSNNADFETSAQVVQKLSSRDKTANDYGLDRGAVARYLRINKLTDPLKMRLDNKEFGIVPAVEISYLSDEEQDSLNMLLDSPIYKVDMKKAAQLRECSAKKTLNTDDIEEILAGLAKKKKSNSNKIPNITLKSKVLSAFYTPQDKPDEIEKEIITALKFYRENKTNGAENFDESEIIEEMEANNGDD